jgi:lysophospholipase L1-like esterase
LANEVAVLKPLAFMPRALFKVARKSGDIHQEIKSKKQELCQIVDICFKTHYMAGRLTAFTPAFLLPRCCMYLRFLLVGLLSTLFTFSPSLADQPASSPLTKKVNRVLFLGDSITHSGHYISMIETRLRLEGIEKELINLGLPSETCSGLSEPDHPFPRPDVHERLDRALGKLKPDLVVACYGMNDGIYYPFSEDRFAAYKSGVQKLIKKVNAAGATLVLMTPPPFDPLPLKKKGKLLPAGQEKYAWFSIYEDYDAVLKKYADYVLEQKDGVLMTVNLHSPVNEYTAAIRKENPDFTMSGDGVHLDEKGHRILANVILKAWGYKSAPDNAPLLKIVHQRQSGLHAAWVSHVGHKRPGVKPGAPLEDAQEIAAQQNIKISELVSKLTSKKTVK